MILPGCTSTGEKLAKAMDVDVANLEETITTYNQQAVKDGKDTKFLKDDEYLKYNVNEGPYYVIKAAALIEDSIGGIYGDSYPDFEGLTLSFALTQDV